MRKLAILLFMGWLSTRLVYGEPFSDPSGKFKLEIPTGYKVLDAPVAQGYSWASQKDDLSIMILPIDMPDAALEQYAENLKAGHEKAGRKVTLADSQLDGAPAKLLVITKKDLYRRSELSIHAGRSVILTVIANADGPAVQSAFNDIRSNFHWAK